MCGRCNADRGAKNGAFAGPAGSYCPDNPGFASNLVLYRQGQDAARSTAVSKQEPPKEGQLILYQTPTGTVRIEVLYEAETFWLSLTQMAELFGRDKSVISRHLANVFADRELLREATVANFATVQSEGDRTVTRQVEYFNLDAIISVGYRVNSAKATQFRVWATQTLREFIIKGFVLDDERLKLNKRFGRDYFDELLERIREIRASERRAYQKIADIFEQCSADYQSHSDETLLFFKIVQNQLHFAVTGKTAAEIIHERADSARPFMGLTTWKNSPTGKILKSDVIIAKNYLNQQEMSKLNRLVGMFIDFAELKALNQQMMTMKDWLGQTEKFLRFTDQQILKTAGKISHEMAVAKAHTEYDKFRPQQDRAYVSEFDEKLARYLKGGKPE